MFFEFHKPRNESKSRKIFRVEKKSCNELGESVKEFRKEPGKEYGEKNVKEFGQKACI